MNRLGRILQLEWTILSRSRASWIIFALYFAGTISVIWLLSKLGSLQFSGSHIPFEQFFHYPQIWGNITWLMRFANILLSLLLVHLVSDQLVSRMHRKHVIDGASHHEILLGHLAKLVLMTLVVLVTAVSLGAIFGVRADSGFFSLRALGYLAALCLYGAVDLLFVLFVVLLLRRAALSIIAIFLWILILEPLASKLLSHYKLTFIAERLPTASISKLIPSPAAIAGFNQAEAALPEIGQWLTVALWGGSFYLLSYAVLRYRNL